MAKAKVLYHDPHADRMIRQSRKIISRFRGELAQSDLPDYQRDTIRALIANAERDIAYWRPYSSKRSYRQRHKH